MGKISVWLPLTHPHAKLVTLEVRGDGDSAVPNPMYSESQEQISRRSSLFVQVSRQHIPPNLPTPRPSKHLLPCLARQADLSVSLEELGQIRHCQLETYRRGRRYKKREVSYTRQVWLKDLGKKSAL